MFTVIIAEQTIIDLYEEFKPFLGQLFRPAEMAFCRWNRDGKNLEEMLPELYDLLQHTDEWRAVIVHPEGLEQKNPFDMVQYQKMDVPYSDTADQEPWIRRRKERFRCYESAAEQPLTRLLNGLCGTGTEVYPMFAVDYKQIMDGDNSLFRYRLEQFLERENSQEIAKRLSQLYARDPRKLQSLVPEEKINELLMAIQEKQTERLLKILRPEDQERFLKLLSPRDPFLCDPEYYETLLSNSYKASLRRKLSENYRLKDHAPYEVICAAARTFHITPEELEKKNSAQAPRIPEPELEFINYNMYPESACYVLFDLVEEDKKQYLFDRMKMMAGLLLLGGYELPRGFSGMSKLYCANLELDSQGVQMTCAEYLGKLSATIRHIDQLIETTESETAHMALPQQTYREAFESEITVRVPDFRSSVGILKADAEDVPLTVSSAEAALASWNKQYNAIVANFTRYLREPGRALEHAVEEDLRVNNKNEDERSGYLSESQKKDLVYHMLGKEQQMVQTETPRLFEPASWHDKVEQAGEKVRSAVSQRMTARQVLWAFGATSLFCFVGFSSLLITNLNTIGSFLFSLVLIAAVLLILGGVALGYAFLMRRRYSEIVKEFNKVMEGLQNEICDGVNRFQDYLSHVCNMMRDCSALEGKEKPNQKRLNILQYHKQTVILKKQDANALFVKYIGHSAGEGGGDIAPYSYDFYTMADYPYEMPGSSRKNKKITFVQKGHEISVPLEYICSFVLESEEMYDRN